MVRLTVRMVRLTVQMAGARKLHLPRMTRIVKDYARATLVYPLRMSLIPLPSTFNLQPSTVVLDKALHRALHDGAQLHAKAFGCLLHLAAEGVGYGAYEVDA